MVAITLLDGTVLNLTEIVAGKRAGGYDGFLSDAYVTFKTASGDIKVVIDATALSKLLVVLSQTKDAVITANNAVPTFPVSRADI